MKSNMTTEMLYVKSIAPHYHEKELQIIVVLKGMIEIHKLDRKEIINEGQFVMVNRNITHWIISKGAYILSSKINLKNFKHIHEKIEYVEFYHIKESIDRDMQHRLNNIIIDSVINNFICQNFQPESYDDSLNENQLISILYSFYRLNNFIKLDDDEYVSDELLDRYYNVVEYVNEHIHEKIVVDDILKYVYMNATYFSQFMKKVGGVGFKEYVSYTKYVKIIQYLINDDLTMSQIASKMGITDMKSFYSLFKKYYRMTPAKLKKTLSGIKNDYICCIDDQILKDFLHDYNIVYHQMNTITKAYTLLVEYQKNKIDLKGLKMRINPYRDMKDYNKKHYQVYKNLTLLIKKADELDVNIDLIFPMHHLMDKKQENLLYNLLLEYVKLYSPHDLKKCQMIFLVKSVFDIDKAKKLKDSLQNISKNLKIGIEID